MAKPVEAEGWPGEGPAAGILYDALPDDYRVVAEPMVYGRPLEAVVLGPQGLFTVRSKGWEGEIYPAQRGPWKGLLPSGREVHFANPVDEAREDRRALEAFLKEELPGSHLAIHPLVLLTNPRARPMAAGAGGVGVSTQASVAERILTAPQSGDPLEPEQQERLARALHERQVSPTQRVREPFVFRSGGFAGSGKKAWTVLDAVRHLDRHPDDGIYHLRNGTLAQWLERQGARNLADLAREAMDRREADARVALESFLLGTGLVPPPRLVARPRKVNLGCALPGEVCLGRVRLRRARGRGYPFGDLRSSESWLRIEPASYHGTPVEVRLSADTEALPLSRTPWRADVLVVPSASAPPMRVPVRLRLVGVPSRLNRWVLRPLAGALLAALVGTAAGWALGRWAWTIPEPLAARVPGAWSPAVFWAAIAGLLWAFLGAVRGLAQPLRWPISHAAARWLLRTLAWGGALAGLAWVAHASWTRFGPEGGPSILTGSLAPLALSAAAFAALPATLGEMRAGRPRRPVPGPERRRRLVRRPALWVTAGIVLLVAVVVGLPVMGHAWQSEDLGQATSSFGESFSAWWSKAESSFNDWMDGFGQRFSDRRAPEQPTPIPTPRPAAGSQSP